MNKYLKNVLLFIFIYFMASYYLKPMNENSDSLKFKSPKGKLTKFRNVTFGMSVKQIKALETSEFIERYKVGNEEILVYSGNINNSNCNILYYFINNKFLCGIYAFVDYHENKELYIVDFFNVSDKLVEKYGDPDYDLKIPTDLTNPNKLADAVSSGLIDLTIGWNFTNGKILEILKKENNKIVHLVSYTLNEFKNKLDKLDKLNKSKNEF